MSRRDGLSSRLRHRPGRTAPALIVGVVLLAAGVGSVRLAIARLVDGSWSAVLAGPVTWLSGLSWNAPVVAAIGTAAVVIGLVLVLCGIVPGGFSAVPLRPGAADDAPPVGERETVMTRRAVAHLARARASTIDGVRASSVSATGRRVHVSVTTSLRDAGDLRERVVGAVSARLHDAGLEPTPRTCATVHTTR